ncbi:nuclear protein 1-like [Hypomesus transpacificus]|uniref:nuclear protein 1-like n=2 Tax=Osmeridae TaxID=8012 RepID=UPI001F07AE25|nr:nuclear protein 1-like [Hypomesus transpacificus]XP_046875970.1 nuclear protein 1-like [Hypomesus transpacificus]
MTSFVYLLFSLQADSRLSLSFNNMATEIEIFSYFEEVHYDQYDYYNLNEYPCHYAGKGRTKREIGLNTNRHLPAGHERKIAEKYRNSELKRRRTKSSSS